MTVHTHARGTGRTGANNGCNQAVLLPTPECSANVSCYTCELPHSRRYPLTPCFRGGGEEGRGGRGGRGRGSNHLYFSETSGTSFIFILKFSKQTAIECQAWHCWKVHSQFIADVPFQIIHSYQLHNL